jgi:hypothetical protein
MVYNEPKAPFNQSCSKTNLKQKRLSLSHNGKNHCTNPKIDSESHLTASPSQRMFLHRGSTQFLLNGAQCLASPVTKKQQRKKPKTKTVVIESQCQKPLSNRKNWLAPQTDTISLGNRNAKTET